jgi:hypothetical protein
VPCWKLNLFAYRCCLCKTVHLKSSLNFMHGVWLRKRPSVISQLDLA